MQARHIGLSVAAAELELLFPLLLQRFDSNYIFADLKRGKITSFHRDAEFNPTQTTNFRLFQTARVCR